MLKPLVEQHGRARVWYVGLAILLYPPTWITDSTLWITDARDFLTLKQALEQLK